MAGDRKFAGTTGGALPLCRIARHAALCKRRPQGGGVVAPSLARSVGDERGHHVSSVPVRSSCATRGPRSPSPVNAVGAEKKPIAAGLGVVRKQVSTPVTGLKKKKKTKKKNTMRDGTTMICVGAGCVVRSGPRPEAPRGERGRASLDNRDERRVGAARPRMREKRRSRTSTATSRCFPCPAVPSFSGPRPRPRCSPLEGSAQKGRRSRAAQPGCVGQSGSKSRAPRGPRNVWIAVIDGHARGMSPAASAHHPVGHGERASSGTDARWRPVVLPQLAHSVGQRRSRLESRSAEWHSAHARNPTLRGRSTDSKELGETGRRTSKNADQSGRCLHPSTESRPSSRDLLERRAHRAREIAVSERPRCLEVVAQRRCRGWASIMPCVSSTVRSSMQHAPAKRQRRECRTLPA